MQTAWPRRPQSLLSRHQNTTGTLAQGPEPECKGERAIPRSARCAYVAGDWRYGEGDPFCGEPAAKGSAYCIRHQRLCQIAPRSETATDASRRLAKIADTAPPPPPELGYLAALPVAEREVDGEVVGELSRALDLDAAIADAAAREGEP
jgi:hypothetical protein